MKKHRSITLPIVLAVLTPTLPVTALAPTSPPAANGLECKSLKGLRTVAVRVERLTELQKELGLSAEQLVTAVQLRLRKAEVQVDEKSLVFLDVNVDARRAAELHVADWAYCVTVSLHQPVRLVTDGSRSVATTWHKGFVGVISSNAFVPVIRQTVGDLVDAFVKDFLAASRRVRRLTATPPGATADQS